MVVYESVDKSAKDFVDEAFSGSQWQVPYFLQAMLQNVALNHEKTSLPLEQLGDFWYWKLSAYGLALMHMLSRSSQDGIHYAESFADVEIQQVPQLMLLWKINEAVNSRLNTGQTALDWDALLLDDVFLREQHIVIDTDRLDDALNRLVDKICSGVYDSYGNRLLNAKQQSLMIPS